MRILHFFGSLLLLLGILAMPAASSAQVSVGVAITFAPPELPVYDQPICPGDGYIWTPGYWAWGDDDYYWVPGTWVLAPEVGFLWTPGYWGWGDGRYIFYDGYWGPVIGFYGGINYGFGYFGHGYEGGRWDNGHFFYNRAVTNVNVTVVRNVYETRIVNNTTTRVSYNGGNGGISERPSPQEQAAARERHIPPVAAQTQHVQAARANPELRASTNHGKPPVAATAKPGELKGGGVVAAREGGTVHQPAARPENNAARPENNAARANPIVHPKDIPRGERPAAANTGNPKTDQKYQQDQERLQAKQDQERQRLQQKQDQEHQKLDQQKANDAKKQQIEQKHQQQTQQLQQRHVQQQQQLQQRQQRPAPRPSPGKPPKS
jgi:WXXGXW repeat (2 copies)